MLCEMFPPQIMDRYLKLKLDVVYKDLPVEVAEQRFKELTEPLLEAEPAPPPMPIRRKARIPKKK
jgi:hypothetical protein